MAFHREQVLALAEIVGIAACLLQMRDCGRICFQINASGSQPEMREYPLTRNQAFTALPGMKATIHKHFNGAFILPGQVQQRYQLDCQVIPLIDQR